MNFVRTRHLVCLWLCTCNPSDGIRKDFLNPLNIGDALAEIVKNRYGYIDYEYGIASASTDFVSTKQFRDRADAQIITKAKYAMVIYIQTSV